MTKHLIAGIYVKEKENEAKTIQVLDKYSSLISHCLRTDGLFTIHSLGEENKFDEMLRKMNEISGVIAKKMVFFG